MKHGWGALIDYRTRIQSLVMLVSDSLPNSLTHSCLVNLNFEVGASEDV